MAVLYVTASRYEKETAASYEALLRKLRKARKPKRAVLYETA